MYEGKPRTLFFRYAVPQMIGLLFNSVYTIVDGVFIGNRLGREAMAAAAVAVPLIEVLISVAIAAGSGAGVLIAARLGAGDRDGARRLFHAAAWMLGLAGLAVCILGNLFLTPLARMLGASPEVLELSAAYLWFIVTFAPFQLFSFLLGGMARNDGRPKLAMRRFAAGAFLGVGAASCGLIFLCSRWFFLLFAPGDPELIAFAATRSNPYFCGFFLTGFNILMISYWQAVQKTGRSLFVSLLRSVILPPALLLALPVLLGREALWVCQSAADGLTALFVIISPCILRRGMVESSDLAKDKARNEELV